MGAALQECVGVGTGEIGRTESSAPTGMRGCVLRGVGDAAPYGMRFAGICPVGAGDSAGPLRLRDCRGVGTRPPAGYGDQVCSSSRAR